jgi:hypothetical protein
MAVAASAGRIGGRGFGAPERAFLMLALVIALVTVGISLSVERSNPSVVSVYDRIGDETYEDLLPAEFEFKRFIDSPPEKGWDTEWERRGVAKFEIGSHTFISYSLYTDPRLAEELFDNHRAGHVRQDFEEPQLRVPQDLYLGAAGVAADSFCVDLGYASECVALDGNAVVTGMSMSTRAERRTMVDPSTDRAKLLLEAGLATVKEAR